MISFRSWNIPSVSLLPGYTLTILCLGTLAPGGVQAQREGPAGPQLIQISPLAAKPGTEFDLVLQGADLGTVRNLQFGVEGLELIRFEEPEKAKPEPRDSSSTPEARRRERTRPRPSNKITARVRVGAAVPTGLVDVRLVTDLGITNPRSLLIRTGQETLEKEPNNDLPEANPLPLGTGVTGQIQTPTDVDYFRIEATRNQKTTLVLRTTSVDSRLAPLIEVFDPKGRPLGKGERLLENDQVVSFSAPEEGTYLVRIASQAYLQGGIDCQYHLCHANEPVIQSVFPPMVTAGQSEKVTLFGWNLPGGATVGNGAGTLEQTVWELPGRTEADLTTVPATVRLPRMASIGGWEERIQGPAGTSAPFLVGMARTKVVLDSGSNEDSAKPQSVEFPAEIAGWFEKRGDRDWYKFVGKKGQVVSLELLGDRLGGTLDLQLAVFRKPAGNAKLGNPLLDLDDNPEILHPQLFFSRTEDPAPTLLTLPDDGEYLVRVSQRESQVMFGPPVRYRLRLGEPQPDFQVVAIAANHAQPGGWNLRPGSTFGVLLFASRRNGFGGPIQIDLEDLPAAVEAESITLQGGQKTGLLLVQAGNKAAEGLSRVRLTATATIGKETVKRSVPVASLLWPHPNPNNNQVVPLLVRMNQGEWLCVRELPSLGATVGAQAKEGHVLAPGKTIELTLKVNRSERFAENCDITIAGSPVQNGLLLRGTLANRPLVLPSGKSEVNVILENRNNQIPPGVYNLALRVHTSEKDGEEKRSIIDFTEAIPLVVAPNRLVDLSANPNPTRWKPGAKGNIQVTLTRTAGYEGPVELEIVFPDGMEKGKATSLTVAPEQNRVQIPLELNEDLPIRPIPLVVRSRVKIGSVERTNDTRLVLQLTK